MEQTWSKVWNKTTFKLMERECGVKEKQPWPIAYGGRVCSSLMWGDGLDPRMCLSLWRWSNAQKCISCKYMREGCEIELYKTTNVEVGWVNQIRIIASYGSGTDPVPVEELGIYTAIVSMGKMLLVVKRWTKFLRNDNLWDRRRGVNLKNAG